MRLTAPAADGIELSIVGYEFPDAVSEGDDDWDANWLMIEGRVTASGRQWRFRDPCLTTWDARALLEWLRSAATDPPATTDALDFVEPALEFRRGPTTAGDRVTIEVLLGDGSVLALHARPAPDPVRLSIPLSRAQLDAAADDWEQQLAAHPTR